MTVYDANKADTMLKAASEMLYGLVAELEKSSAMCDDLRKQLAIEKAANAEKVTLEKVPTITEKSANAFAQVLVDRNLITPDDIQKCAKVIASSPENLIKVATDAIISMDAPVGLGTGIPSTYSNYSDDNTEARVWEDYYSSCNN